MQAEVPVSVRQLLQVLTDGELMDKGRKTHLETELGPEVFDFIYKPNGHEMQSDVLKCRLSFKICKVSLVSILLLIFLFLDEYIYTTLTVTQVLHQVFMTHGV